MVDFATSQIHNVGNPNILNSAMNRNIFTPQALKYANMAKNFGGTALRYSGIMNPMGAAATAAYVTPKVIDYLTKRDPNATRSSLFNIDLTKNANERAALPGSTLNDWGSSMGPIPDDGVVPPRENINKPLNTLDPNWQHQLKMQDIDRGNIDNKGFNFPSIFGTVKGGLEWLGDKFKRPEAKQRAYEEIMKGGTYKGKPGYELYETPSGLKIGSDILGTGQGYAKNFDSMFGSKSIEEMEQKKLDWARERIRKGKAISQRLQTQVDLADAGGKTITDPVITSTGGTTGPNVHGGGSEASFTRTSPGGISQATSRAARTDQGGNVMSGWRLAEGGRVGLYAGGDPEEPAENIFNFMQDQGIPHSEQVEGEEGILQQLYAKYIEAGFPPDQAEAMAMEEFEQMATGPEQDQGIASLV